MSNLPDSKIDPTSLAQEFYQAYTNGALVQTPPSSRDVKFDMDAAYAVESEFMRKRTSDGRRAVGLKVGYANKAMWRVFGLETLVWAHMYDDTVHYANGMSAEFVLPPHRAPKIEPEIVLKLRTAPPMGTPDAATVLEHVEWLAIGFEIIDCPFADWQFKPADFVAAFGLHLGLVVGEPVPVRPEQIPDLAESLANFKLSVFKDSQFVEKGSGKNSLRSPALCLAELAEKLYGRAGAVPLSAGDIVSSGTLTAGQALARGDVWSVELEGLAAPGLTVRFS